MAIMMKTSTQIFDSQSGVLLLEAGVQGEILDFIGVTDKKDSDFISTKLNTEIQAKRRLLFNCYFPSNGFYTLVYPDNFQFLDERIGLLNAILTGETIAEVKSLAPTPRYRASIESSYAVTFVFQKNMIIYNATLIIDFVSGSFDIEIEVSQ